MLVKITRRFNARGDEGSTLVSVLIIMLVLSLGGMTLAAIVTNTTGILVDTRSTAQSRAAADAGLADAIGRGQRGEDLCALVTSSATAPKYSVTAECAGGAVTITSIGTGQDGGTTTTKASYTLAATSSSLAGALVSAGGSLNVSSIDITAIAIDGNIVLDTGSFDCNNSMEISGDLIVRDGSVSLSNACRIRGDLIVSGNVQIQNNAVGVDGDVYTMGTFTLSTTATVAGNVYAKGTATVTSGGKIIKSMTSVGNASVDGTATSIGGSVVTGGTVKVNAATITGSVVAASTGAADFFNGTVGAIRVAGPLNKLQGTTVKGNVISTSTTQSRIESVTKIEGDLTLASTYTGAGPVVTGVKTLNKAGLVAPSAPTVAEPWALSDDAFVWADLPFTLATWAGAGYSMITTPGCDFQGSWSAANVAVINARATPTVVDARSCSDLNLYDATFNLKTDVTFLVKSAKAQRLKLNSADGAAHIFNLITPDATADHLPSCTTSGAKIDIGDVVMSTKISGIAYSPCTVHIGQSSGGGRWNGQVYAGKVEWGGNSTPRMQLDYKQVNVPGLIIPTASGGGAGGASTLSALVSLRDVP